MGFKTVKKWSKSTVMHGQPLFIRPFEKRSYYVIPLGVRPSVRPSVLCNSSYSLRPIELKLGI